MIYPGGLGVPEIVPSNAPPSFFLVANDDRGHVEPVVKLLNKFRDAKVPIEVHLYAQGGHGFNMGQRSKLKSIKDWPQRLSDWLSDTGILEAPAKPSK